MKVKQRLKLLAAAGREMDRDMVRIIILNIETCHNWQGEIGEISSTANSFFTENALSSYLVQFQFTKYQ